jgi:Protein of unknown function (DUF4058)
MQPKFPGMNPYLENPELWAEVHFGLISVLARTLNAVIYRAAVEKRVYSDSLLVGIPDVSVFQRGTEAAEFPRTTATLSEPLVVTVPVVEETQERFLEIREVGTGTVVTVVEVLSPKNKRSGEGKVKHDAKRQAVLNSTANLVEIDLLRTGEPKPMAGVWHPTTGFWSADRIAVLPQNCIRLICESRCHAFCYRCALVIKNLLWTCRLCCSRFIRKQRWI